MSTLTQHMLLAWHAHRAVLSTGEPYESVSPRALRKPNSCTRRRCLRGADAGNLHIVIRHATHGDLRVVHELSQEGNIGWSLGQLQAELELDFSTVLVSSKYGQTHGFTCGWHVGGELQVMALVVSQYRQRQGIGRALLEELLRIGKGLGDTSACLEFREGNMPAVNLYLRTGFEKVGRRRNYYDNGDAAILMFKSL